jgi:heme oxygenase
MKQATGTGPEADGNPRRDPCGGGALADAMRERTRALHAEAERSGIIAQILRQRADIRGYALLLRNLLPVYRELERGLWRHRLVAPLDALCQPAVFRAASMERDLAILAGRGWEQELPPLTAGERYAARVAQAAADTGVRLIAHVYVRYLGDLNGGQVLRALLAQALGLEEQVLSFYAFPEIQDLPSFKVAYRGAINTAGLAVRDCGALVEEAAVGFELSIALSEAVQSAVLDHGCPNGPGNA